MSSNNATFGLGRSLLTGGFAGTGLATGSVELIQNPSFETAGATAGNAANWEVSIVSSAVAFAAFTRPGLSVVTDTVPSTLGDAGISIVDNLDGTITLMEAADVQVAQEDFEAAWSNNDQYLFVFPGTALGDCFFGVREIEDFENGWLNDPGELDVFDEVASAPALFSYHINPSTLAVLNDPFDSFEGRWPASAPNFFISGIPEVVFGTATYQGAYAQNPQGIITDASSGGELQYADALLMTVTDLIPDDLAITITYLDKEDHIRTRILSIPALTPVGTILDIISSPYVGVRSVDSVVATTTMPGVIFHGEPGFLLDADQHEAATWERAKFDRGLETFQIGWHDNENIIFHIESVPTADAGFGWIIMADLDTGLNVFSDNLAFTLPDYAVTVNIVVATVTGFALSPNIITISYLNQIGVVKTTTFGPVVSGAPAGTSFSVDLAVGDTGVLDVTNLTSGTSQTGVLSFMGSSDFVEAFSNLEWPAPDPGL